MEDAPELPQVAAAHEGDDVSNGQQHLLSSLIRQYGEASAAAGEDVAAKSRCQELIAEIDAVVASIIMKFTSSSSEQNAQEESQS
jgi:hypothetical protein